MKKLIFPLAVAAVLTSFTAAAQDDSARSKAEKDAMTQAQKEREALQQDQQRNQQDMQERQEDLKNRQRELQERSNDVRDRVRMKQERLADIQRRLNDYDEIVIKRKNDKNEKVTIEINNDEVKVNGKPIEDFNNEDVSVRVRSPRRLTLNAPSSPFGNQNSFWREESDGRDHALLGVASSGSDDGQAVVSKVTDGSAAGKAGIKTGDIITKIDDHTIADFAELSKVIDQYKPGEKVTITYKRNGKEKHATAVLDKRPAGQSFSFNSNDNDLSDLAVPIPPIPPIPPIAPNADLHFNFDHNFDYVFNGEPRVGIKAQDTEDGKGVRVLGVDGASAAEKAGLKADDVITSVDGRAINGADDLKQAFNDAKTKPTVKIELKRNGKTENVELKVPRKLKTANL